MVSSVVAGIRHKLSGKRNYGMEKYDTSWDLSESKKGIYPTTKKLSTENIKDGDNGHGKRG